MSPSATLRRATRISRASPSAGNIASLVREASKPECGPPRVLDQPDLSGQEVDSADATGGDGPSAVGQFVMDVGGGHHRLGTFDAGLVLDAAEDSPLATVQLAMDTGIHSKTSWR